MASIILAINRCVEYSSPKLSARLFSNGRVDFWLALATIYGFYATFFTTPIKFTGLYVSWYARALLGSKIKETANTQSFTGF